MILYYCTISDNPVHIVNVMTSFTKINSTTNHIPPDDFLQVLDL